MAKSKTSGQPANAVTKCPTGIHGLDEVTLGGLPRGRPTLVCGSAGCGKTLLGMEFLVRGATIYDEPGVCVSFEETDDELRQNVASLGFDVKALIAQKKLAIEYVHIERSLVEESGSTIWRRYSSGLVWRSIPLGQSELCSIASRRCFRASATSLFCARNCGACFGGLKTGNSLP